MEQTQHSRASEARIRISLVIVAVGAVVAAGALALPANAMSEQEYFEALRAVNERVEKLRERRSGLDAARSAARPEGDAGVAGVQGLRGLRTRAYQVGDSWTVIAMKSEEQRVAALKMAPDAAPRPAPELGVFRYTVVEAPERSGEIEIRVEPQASHGISLPDSRVRSLTLRADASFLQKAKVYAFGRGGSRERRVPVSPDGIRSNVTPLELFPIDLPRIELGEGRRVAELPELPAGIARVARESGYDPKPGDGLWFEEQDFFGRPVELFWRQGDPWPAYIKTPQGLAILVSKGGRR